jgi:YD repeat-containing protein
MKLVLFIVFGFVTLTSNGQNAFTYQYDANGNRIERNVTQLRISESGASVVTDQLIVAVSQATMDSSEHALSEPNDMVEAFPIPTFTKITVRSKNGGAIGDIRIFNSVGEILIEKKNIPSEVDLDLSYLSRGDYFIWTSLNTNGKLIKIIKN